MVLKLKKYTQGLPSEIGILRDVRQTVLLCQIRTHATIVSWQMATENIPKYANHSPNRNDLMRLVISLDSDYEKKFQEKL